MRQLPARWTGRFDAVLNLFTSFGFFIDPARRRAGRSREFARVLKPGGVLVWHGGSRDGVMARFLARDWWKADDGTMIGARALVRSALRRPHHPVDWDGPRASGEREHRIRLYTATRLAELCADAGLIVEEAYDGFATAPLRGARARCCSSRAKRRVAASPLPRRSLPA